MAHSEACEFGKCNSSIVFLPGFVMTVCVLPSA